MSEERHLKVSVQVFDRYSKTAEGLSSNEAKTECCRRVKVSSSSLLYRDEIPTEIQLQVKSVVESHVNGLLLLAETDGLIETSRSKNDESPQNETSKKSETDSLFETQTMSEVGSILDETEELNTGDLFNPLLWEVWLSLEHGIEEEEQLQKTSHPVRELRAKCWNRFIDPKIAFKAPERVELCSDYRNDPFSSDTLSFSGRRDDLGLGEEDLQSIVDVLESAHELVEQSSKPKLCGYVVRQHRITLESLAIKSLKDEMFQPSTSEQNASSSDQIIVSRTIEPQHVESLLNSVRPLLNLIKRLHDHDLCLGGFDPSLFGQMIDHSDLVAPLAPLALYKTNVGEDYLKVSGEESALHLGFSPPEMYGYFNGIPQKQSDVFSAGMLLYYAITGCPRFAETRRPFFRLPSPFVYRQELPPELVAVVYRAISPSPDRRQKDMTHLMHDLDWALESTKLRLGNQEAPLRVEAAHEIHIGLLKGQYNPINQDDLFLGYQADLDLGMFVVTDGVSICEYGSGDLASGFVREAAVEHWRELCQVQTLTEEEDTLSELTLGMIEGATGNYGKFLTQMINDSNRRIGEYVNQQIPTFHGPPEGIMAATIVAAMINQGNATFTSVGDSRIYLIRGDYIVSLMYDEDLYTHLLQARQSPMQAQQSPSASALIHCIGEFVKGEDQKIVPAKIIPQLKELKMIPGDYLVLCSDGIPDYTGIDEEDSEEKIRRCVLESYNVHHAAFELIALANRGGGGDNLSCIVLKFTADSQDEDQDGAQ